MWNYKPSDEYSDRQDWQAVRRNVSTHSTYGIHTYDIANTKEPIDG